MFNIGMPELVLVFVVGLLIFGPRKLPEMGRMLGKAMREFKKAADDFKASFDQEISDETEYSLKNNAQDLKKDEEEMFG